jgi:NADH dehydrogenase [ubiquinone] 1 alpha subcomplex assembly factor 6
MQECAAEYFNFFAAHSMLLFLLQSRDFENQSHMTMESLRAYSESTSSTIFYLLLDLLGISSSSVYSHAASHLGLAHSLTTLLRGLPFHASKGHIVIPAEITAKHKVRHEDVIRKGGSALGISDAVYEFACIAKEELDVAREQFDGGKVPREAHPVFLSAVSLEKYRRVRL